MNSAADFPWPRVIEVEPQAGCRLRVRLDTGAERLLDLSDLLARRDAYWRLRHPRYFNQVAIDPLGGLCWPEGEDLAADGLDRYACEPAAPQELAGPQPGAGPSGAHPPGP